VQRAALWADLIHNCNIDFLKKASFHRVMIYAIVFKRLITIMQIDNTKRIAKTIPKYLATKIHLIHILSRMKVLPVENSERSGKESRIGSLFNQGSH
jgi:hypothetical protein